MKIIGHGIDITSKTRMQILISKFSVERISLKILSNKEIQLLQQQKDKINFLSNR
jgi:phosphopantetheinyl transferase (holo-ACP synthase)